MRTAKERDTAAAKADVERQAKRKQEIIDWNKAAQQRRAANDKQEKLMGGDDQKWREYPENEREAKRRADADRKEAIRDHRKTVLDWVDKGVADVKRRHGIK